MTEKVRIIELNRRIKMLEEQLLYSGCIRGSGNGQVSERTL